MVEIFYESLVWGILRIAILLSHPLKNMSPGNETSMCETHCSDGMCNRLRLGTIPGRFFFCG